MAKEIKPETESSAARFLTLEGPMSSVDRASENASHSKDLSGTPAPTKRDVPRSQQKVKREFVLTRETDAVLHELVGVLRDTSDARLSASHVVRGIARLLMNHLPAIRNASVACGPRRLPSTGADQAQARLEFEHYLAGVFELALTGRPSQPLSGHVDITE